MPKTIQERQGLSQTTIDLLASREDRNLDFKESAGGVKASDFVAFTNGDGGTILIGVAETEDALGNQRGTIVGCEIDDKTRQSIISKAASCRPGININMFIENLAEGLPIIRIEIPKGENKPYCTASGTYKMRADGQNIAIDPMMMKQIIMEVESEEFIGRFKSAGDELVDQMKNMQSDLSDLITEAKQATKDARDITNDNDDKISPLG